MTKMMELTSLTVVTMAVAYALVAGCAVAPAGGSGASANASGGDKDDWALLPAADGTTLDIPRGDLLFGTAMDGQGISKDQVHVFELFAVEGSVFTIDMSDAASNLDSYLEVTAPDGRRFVDDDGGAGYDAHIRVEGASATGTYIVRATTYRSAGTGSYDLIAQCLSDTCTELPPPDPDQIPVGGTWQSPADPFDPSTCAGTPLSVETLRALMDWPTSLERELGVVELIGRHQVCYSGGACTAWVSSADEAPVYWVQHYGYNPHGTPPQPMRSGYLDVIYTNNQPYLQLRMDGYIKGAGSYDGSRIAFNHIGDHLGFVELPAPRFEDTVSYLPTGVITDRCFGVVGRHTYDSHDGLGNNVRIEYQAAVRILPSAP